MKYKALCKDGSTVTITAARFEQDGAGTRFYDPEGALLANFYDGELRRVFPEESPVETPPEAIPPEPLAP